jgi:hypothetical protein
MDMDIDNSDNDVYDNGSQYWFAEHLIASKNLVLPNNIHFEEER